MLAGLTAGALAAVPATLVQLPLHSPVDVLFNSLTVAAGSLAAGIASGALWWVTRGSARGPRLFAVMWAAVFLAVCGAAVAGDTQLDRTVSFVLPLAAIVMAATGILTPLLSRSRRLSYPVAVTATAVAVGLGIGLAFEGDARSGQLELPPRVHRFHTAPEGDGVAEVESLFVLVGGGQVGTLVV